jgi:UDP-hydrolysing UDP-N-acetyl-D-glucosamine 2-epimerase
VGSSEVAPRRICIVTTSRADYGLLTGLMRAVRDDDELELQLVAAAMHLSPEFGLTFRDIERDGFRIDRKVEMLLSADSDVAATKSIGVGLLAFADTFDVLRPDIVVVLGDRFELLSAAVAALMARIPLAHIHGGETSQGAVDESVRHAITKMAVLHFTATEAYRDRILQMGEDPTHSFAFGAPGLDALNEVSYLTRPELESRLSFALTSPTALVTYHPVTLEKNAAEGQIDALLNALTRERVRAIFTKANADVQGRLINHRLAEFCREHPADYRLYDNLGQALYLSCLRHVDLMVGNSSSGLIEAPSFALPAVNIGDRQRGRIRAANVIDVGYSTDEIASGIRRALSPTWRDALKNMENPYAGHGGGKVSERIKERLKTVELGEPLLKKRFCDLVWRDSSRPSQEDE